MVWWPDYRRPICILSGLLSDLLKEVRKHRRKLSVFRDHQQVRRFSVDERLACLIQLERNVSGLILLEQALENLSLVANCFSSEWILNLADLVLQTSSLLEGHRPISKIRDCASGFVLLLEGGGGLPDQSLLFHAREVALPHGVSGNALVVSPEIIESFTDHIMDALLPLVQLDLTAIESIRDDVKSTNPDANFRDLAEFGVDFCKETGDPAVRGVVNPSSLKQQVIESLRCLRSSALHCFVRKLSELVTDALAVEQYVVVNELGHGSDLLWNLLKRQGSAHRAESCDVLLGPIPAPSLCVFKPWRILGRLEPCGSFFCVYSSLKPRFVISPARISCDDLIRGVLHAFAKLCDDPIDDLALFLCVLSSLECIDQVLSRDAVTLGKVIDQDVCWV